MSGMMVPFFELFQFPVQLLLTYGYGALFAWSILEGEIGLMLAGWLASEGKVFDYPHVVAVAFGGALIGDLTVFLIGRLFERRAMAWLNAHPRRKYMAMGWLQRWGGFVIIFERFVYGTHIPVLLTLGMSGYSFVRFLLLDLFGILLWSVTFVSLGYSFGRHIIQFILFAQKNIFLIFFLFFVFLLLLRLYRTEPR